MAVFHALKPIPAFVDTTAWQNFCQSMDDEALRSWLDGQGLLVESEVEDDLFRDAIIEETLTKRMMSILYLVLTKACNFRCRQCFQPERHPQDHLELAGAASLMTKETAMLGIDAFARHLNESEADGLEPQIYFYGGEPLLNWDVLVDAVEYVELLRGRELPEEIGFVVITNGSLVDHEKADFFARHNIGVGLSIDGPKEKNDAFRILAHGQGTYDKIVSVLRILQEHNVGVTLSITINPNIANDLPGIIQWAKEELGVDSVSFNMVGGGSYAHTGAEFSLEAYNDMVATGLVEAYQLARNIGLHEDRVGRKAEDFIYHSFKAVDCGAVNNQLVIQPDGLIAFCHASTEYNVGSVRDPEFRIFGHPAIQAWEDVLPIHNPKCQSCPAMSICGYGCFHHMLELERPLADGDDQFCLHTRRVMDFLVWDLLAQSQQQEE
ncbi:MAG: radical SAM protein [Candidatus Moraniibacteriota bacterium]